MQGANPTKMILCVTVGHDRAKDQEADQRTPFAWEDEAELQEL